MPFWLVEVSSVSEVCACAMGPPKEKASLAVRSTLALPPLRRMDTAPLSS